MTREKLKREVLATIINDLRQASKETGREHWRIASDLFPDVPHGVVTEACLELDDEAENAWWDQMERTIDGEVIRRAIEAPKAEPTAGKKETDLDAFPF